MDHVQFEWRGRIDNHALNALHADAFEHDIFEDDWQGLVERHSLGWVLASDSSGPIGFINVPWDGGVHAWLQDVIVAKRARRAGVASRMIDVATAHARTAGCEWLHVDFDEELTGFYIEACGFTPTAAGLKRL